MVPSYGAPPREGRREVCPHDNPRAGRERGKLGVAIVGGHTEVTPGLDRPIVIGTMLGTVEKERLVLPGRIRSGDKIVLTKWVGLEGTAIIAEERGEGLEVFFWLCSFL